jgi:hypothetical protein
MSPKKIIKQSPIAKVEIGKNEIVHLLKIKEI